MLFAVVAVDQPGSLELRMATRKTHFDYANATGAVRLGGPFLNEKGEMAGSLIIIEAKDLDAAKSWVANDPYTKAGLFQQSEIRPWKMTFNGCGATLE